MQIKPGLYQHFKGNRYKVIGVGFHTENLQELVAYQGLYHDKEYGEHPIWIRPVEMFYDHVSRDGYVGPRFQLLSEHGPFVCKDCGKEI